MNPTTVNTLSRTVVPTTNTISKTTDIDVSLEYEKCTSAELTSTPLFPPSRSRYLDLNALVVNSSKIKDVRYAPSREITSNDPEFYYIITPRNLKKAFRDLVLWKQQKGYRVVLKCIEDIYEDPRYQIGSIYRSIDQDYLPEEIVDSAMSLRCYLKDQFDINGHFFCLLGGDWRTPMPIRYALSYKTNSKSNDHSYPTDAYFCDLTYRFNLHKHPTEQFYSLYTNDKSPFYTSISIGRLLCASEKEITNYLNKAFIYEGDPGHGDTDYLSKALFVEECNLKWNKEGEEVEGNCLINDSQKARLACDYFKDVLLYQDLYHTNLNTTKPLQQDILPSEYADGPSAPEVLKTLSRVGYGSLHVHGSPYGVAVGCHGHVIYSHEDYMGKAPYNYPIYHNLPGSGLNNFNNRFYPSILYSVSCQNAPFDVLIDGTKFDGITLGRGFTTEYETGVAAALMHSRSAYTASAWNIEVSFLNNIKTLRNVGECIRHSISKSNGAYNEDRYSMNLIGDPELEMWLDKPITSNLNIIPNSNGVEVQGNLPESAYCVLSNGISHTDKYGEIENNLTNPYQGEYCFSVWKTGYLPTITLLGQKGSLSESKRYIVRNAQLGTVNDNGGMCTYSVIDGGNLSVKAFDDISIYQGFSIENGGVVEFDCNNTVNLNGGIVRNGGTLVIKAKDVKMASGFKVELGGILKIINN